MGMKSAKEIRAEFERRLTSAFREKKISPWDGLLEHIREAEVMVKAIAESDRYASGPDGAFTGILRWARQRR